MLPGRPKKDFGATGARSLRGGKNKYSAKTLNGNWVEAQYDPAFADVDVDASNSDDKYITIAQMGLREGAQQPTRQEIGAALVKQETGCRNIIAYNEKQYKSADWESVTRSTHRGGESKVGAVGRLAAAVGGG